MLYIILGLRKIMYPLLILVFKTEKGLNVIINRGVFAYDCGCFHIPPKSLRLKYGPLRLSRTNGTIYITLSLSGLTAISGDFKRHPLRTVINSEAF